MQRLASGSPVASTSNVVRLILVDKVRDPWADPDHPEIMLCRHDNKLWAYPRGMFKAGDTALFVGPGYTLSAEGPVKRTFPDLKEKVDVDEWFIDGAAIAGVMIQAPQYLNRNLPTSMYETDGIRRTSSTNLPAVRSPHTPSGGYRAVSFYPAAWGRWPLLDSEFKDREVAVLEYVEGQAVRYCLDDKSEFSVHTLKAERKYDGADPLWRVAQQYNLAEMMRDNGYEAHTIIGMLWGNVRGTWTYGRKGVGLYIMDIQRNGLSPLAENGQTSYLPFVDIAEMSAKLKVPHLPLLSIEEYDKEVDYLHGPSRLYPGPRAGAVIVRMLGRTAAQFHQGYAIEKLPSTKKAKKEDVNTDAAVY